MRNSVVGRWSPYYVPAEHDVDLAAVAQLSAGAGDGEAAERGAAEVEVRAAPRADAAGALVRDDDRDGAARADAAVEAPDLVAGAAALAGLEQHGAHRAHARLHRHHVHQRPVPARAAWGTFINTAIEITDQRAAATIIVSFTQVYRKLLSYKIKGGNKTSMEYMHVVTACFQIH
jgi:hypothetical protein